MAVINSSVLKILSYNCRGYNITKRNYVASLMAKCNILFLQEHWLSDAQLSLLSSISDGVSFHAISGFGNSEVLAGRPYGGCAILYQSALLVNMCPISVDSRRICAVRVCSDSIKLLLVNVYMPYEDNDDNIDEFVSILTLVEDLIRGNSDCHLVLGGDFNVDFRRERVHTALLTGFCEDIGLMSITNHPSYKVDYTYNFNMSYFSIIDHFILSSALYNECMSDAVVFHDIDNLSDHEPIMLQINIDVASITLRSRIYTPRASWVKASESNINDYRLALSTNLKHLELPTAMLLCSDMRCTNAVHIEAINQYAAAITEACLSAAESSIPHTSNRQHAGLRRTPGWSERVEPHRDKSLFWHGLWVECGRPRSGVVADCMRRTRSRYHYAIRQVKRDEDSIIKERLANALIVDPSRNFWSEVKRIRNNKMCTSNVVDGCIGESSITELFANKYRSLYSCVSFDDSEMSEILADLEDHMFDGGLRKRDHIFTSNDVTTAIQRLYPHKNEGNNSGLSTDHFIHAGSDLAIHIALLFSCMVTHGFSPTVFGASTIIPIPKKHHTTDSNNFRGIALSSVFCKLFDNIILDKFRDKLCSSELQFGFKTKSSTNMCTMVLKETITYYIKHQSSVYCTFLDASKAFDRVHYCKLFRLLIKRGLPACIIRILINMYTGNQACVLWAGFVSDYFTVRNGVRQGGVVSPILFCIYIDDLLLRLSLSGVGCYIGLSFAGALAYADDIVLIAPTPNATRKLLAICDDFAAQYDIVFNADKSKFLVIVPHKRRFLYNDMSKCSFFINGKLIENVIHYSHLGHIINTEFNDDDDILHRRNSFIGQVNNLLCFFNKQDILVKLKLFQSYCSSIYGCELWALNNGTIDVFCTAWRKALRRVFSLPFNAHSYLLPIISCSLPLYDEIVKRSSRFIISCLFSTSRLVQAVSWYSIVYGKYGSVFGRNAMICCNRYNWSLDLFKSRSIPLTNNFFSQHFRANLTDYDLKTALSLLEVLFLREGHFDFSAPFTLSFAQLTDIINSLATL